MATLEQLEQRILAIEQKLTNNISDGDPYLSAHDGPEIDAAVNRASEGGAIDQAMQMKPGKNLLDNWYFGNPVNQRVQTSYSVNGYTIDRWYTAHSKSYGTLIVDQTAGCVTISHDDDGGFVDFIQTLENPATEIVTLSVLMLSGNLYSATGTLGSILLNTDEIFIRSDEPNKVILRCKTGKTISIIAAKLELGSQQTLAHKDANGNWVLNEIPDYGEQLLRCQRYFQLDSTADKRPAKAVDCRPVMRADPSQGTIAIDGATYYYNTAEL